MALEEAREQKGEPLVDDAEEMEADTVECDEAVDKHLAPSAIRDFVSSLNESARH